MIRDVVIHLLNEQPVVADLMEMPVASDVGILCTNVRTPDGRRPIFIDRMDSTFVFPYHNVRFIEIPRQPGDLPGPGTVAEGTSAQPPATEDADLEIDQAFLERVRNA